MNEALENLQHHVKTKIAEIQEAYTQDTFDEYIKNQLDVIIEKYIYTPNEIIGFSILLTMGGPNIKWDYHRGYSEVIGTWADDEYSEQVDTKIAEKMLDVIAEEAD